MSGQVLLDLLNESFKNDKNKACQVCIIFKRHKKSNKT